MSIGQMHWLLRAGSALPKISPCPATDAGTRSTGRLLGLLSTSEPRPSSPRSGLFLGPRDWQSRHRRRSTFARPAVRLGLRKGPADGSLSLSVTRSSPRAPTGGRFSLKRCRGRWKARLAPMHRSLAVLWVPVQLSGRTPRRLLPE